MKTSFSISQLRSSLKRKKSKIEISRYPREGTYNLSRRRIKKGERKEKMRKKRGKDRGNKKKKEGRKKEKRKGKKRKEEERKGKN